MKRVNVAKLKASLSHYLRLARKGERIVVLDRKRPVAEIVSLSANETPWERLAREGKCRLGSQEWGDFQPPRLKKAVPIEKILHDVSADTE